jgi:hypothetical protein
MTIVSLSEKRKKTADPHGLLQEWFTRVEAAAYLASIGCPVSVRSLEKKASNHNEGKGPAFTRVGWRTVKYNRRDLDTWAFQQTVRVP